MAIADGLPTVRDVLARIGALDKVYVDRPDILDRTVSAFGFCTTDVDGHVEIRAGHYGRAFFEMRGLGTSRFYLVYEPSDTAHRIALVWVTRVEVPRSPTS